MQIASVITFFAAVGVQSTVALAHGQSAKLHFIQLAQQRLCPQVIVCGTKNGVTKEYRTSCAAEDDGATNIKPKPPSGCASEK